MEDVFYTIEGTGQGEFKDRGSKFLGYALPLASEEQLEEQIQDLRRRHPKARHYCYAYRLGTDGRRFRMNDDGEPGGTAGRPILGQIDRLGLTDVLVVVVRYFGGTLLGTGGLIQAYREAAARALTDAPAVEQHLMQEVFLEVSYEHVGELMDIFNRLDFVVRDQSFERVARFRVAIRKSLAHTQVRRMKAILAGISLEEAEERDDLPGLSVTWVP